LKSSKPKKLTSAPVAKEPAAQTGEWVTKDGIMKAVDKKPLPDGRIATTLVLPEKGSGNGSFRSVGGSEHEVLNRGIMGQLMRTTWAGGVPRDDPDGLILWECMIPSIAAAREFEPKDTQEALLIAQMVATYNAAMECYRRAMLKEQSFEAWNAQLNQANKLVRSYATLQQTLDKHRGKGQQKVTVEHVHVYQGGQAVVGNVEAGGGRPLLSQGADPTMPIVESMVTGEGGVLVEAGK
jgi:hypothetical protein